MTEKILTILFIFIKSLIAISGYGGIVVLMGIESACIPLPSELIMPFAGYLVFEGTMKLFWVAAGSSLAAASWTGLTASSPAGDISPSSSAACFPWCGPSSPCLRELPACPGCAFTSTHF